MYEGNDRRDEDDHSSSVRTSRTGVSPLLIAFVVLAILAVVFVLQNGAETRIEFLVFDVTASVWVAIAISIAVGVLLDRLLTVWRRRRRNG